MFPRTSVILRVGSSPERVLIEIEDQCGGLATANTRELFLVCSSSVAPTERASVLASPSVDGGAQVNDRRVYTRNIPGKWCVFTLDLPRVAAPACGEDC